MCVLFDSSFVCISAYANVYFKTKIIKQNIQTILIAGVPSSQALPGFRITAPPSVCVPDVIGVLAVWIQKKSILWFLLKSQTEKKQDKFLANDAWDHRDDGVPARQNLGSGRAAAEGFSPDQSHEACGKMGAHDIPPPDFPGPGLKPLLLPRVPPKIQKQSY